MVIKYKGSCHCSRWQVEIQVHKPLEALNPRICDCSYCQSNSSKILSEPGMVIELIGGEASSTQNGDKLATFFHCDCCGDFLAVGCDIDGHRRGAVNASLLQDAHQLGKPIQIQPRLLSPSEKLERWGKLWGQLKGV